MTHRITATAPTAYQYQSLCKFNLNNNKNGNGSFTGTMDFYSEQDAKDYLINRAEMYYDEYEGQVDEHIEDIEKYGVLTIDAATARIEEIDQDEEE
ncbi:MAG: hypothetical protein WAT92_00355 [Saprospiraceae bacterium]